MVLKYPFGKLPEFHFTENWRKNQVFSFVRQIIFVNCIHSPFIINPVQYNKFYLIVRLQKLDISQYRNKKIEELSKGNQQKVQFITAIIHNPRLIVLDEPFAGFDPLNQQLIREIIISLSGMGKTIILSTHQMDTAEKLCSDIFLINKGKEVCSGNMIDIKKSFGTNTIRIIFEGDGSFINSLPYVIRAEQSDSFLDTGDTASSLEVTLKEDIHPKDFLKDKRRFLLALLENPNLLEHETFTELLNAVFHLAEELDKRKDINHLPHADYQHLKLDTERAYNILIYEWIAYMEHLMNNYPYLFSLAMRTNPFDPNATVEIQDH